MVAVVVGIGWSSGDGCVVFGSWIGEGGVGGTVGGVLFLGIEGDSFGFYILYLLLL